MQKRIGPMVSVVIIGIFVGVVLTVQITTKSILVGQFSQVIASLRNIENIGRDLGRSLSKGKRGKHYDKGERGKHYNKGEIKQQLETLSSQQKEILAMLKELKKANDAKDRRPKQRPQEDYKKVHTIGIAHSPVRGKKDAPITIVEFVDFQCPFSQRFQPVVNQVLEAYPEEVKVVLKNFPLKFHPQASPAGKAAFAAGEQGKYFEMVELLLKNNRDLSEEKFEELAKELGLNVKKFKKDYQEKDTQWEKYIQEDISLGNSVGVRGTPTFYINGRKTRARDLNRFKKEIDEILKDKK